MHYKRKHEDFILSPIYNIIADANYAYMSLGRGIEMSPLTEYMFQTIFLKMTGAQEQKFKCLCWDIATDIYDFRYETFGSNALGECSSLDDRNNIIKKILKSCNIKFDYTEKENFLNNAKMQIDNIKDSLLKDLAPHQYIEALQIIDDIKGNHVDKYLNNYLFETNDDASPNKSLLGYIYKKHLYMHRNRCAHNLMSYQDNLPSIKVLSEEKNKYNNYFLYFYLLILIDEILKDIYQKFIQHSLMSYV